MEIASTITGEDISSYLNILASDEMEGRATGTEGNKMAAEYIAQTIESFGIPPVSSIGSYFQEVTFTKCQLSEVTLAVNDSSYDLFGDYVFLLSELPSNEVTIDVSDVVFMGYGIDDERYSDYAKAKDLNGKTILIYSGEPVSDEGISMVTGTTNMSEWSGDLVRKLEVAKARGVNAAVVISPGFLQTVSNERRNILNGQLVMGDAGADGGQAAHVIVSSKLAADILGKKSGKVIKRRDKARNKGKLKPVSVPVALNAEITRQTRSTEGVNVLAYIEGTDPNLKDELIVITAHYDHVGTRGGAIYNGADDNASGTSGVLELAQAFQEAKSRGVGPRRSVLCMLVTAEEIGLLGSQYYSENPVFPLENTVANINIDMIGRVDAQHEDSNYIYVIGADRLSTELHEINEEANRRYTQLALDYTYNAPDDPNQFYYRSDHYNFAKNGVPSVFYFSGVHEDYHRPTDTADKIMFDKAAKVMKLAFHTAWELANREARIKVDVVR